MPKNKLNTYQVYFTIDLYTSIEIKAASLEEALVLAQEYKVADVIEIPGEHIDSTVELTGVIK